MASEAYKEILFKVLEMGEGKTSYPYSKYPLTDAEMKDVSDIAMCNGICAIVMKERNKLVLETQKFKF